MRLSGLQMGLLYDISNTGLWLCFIFLQMDQKHFSYNFSPEIDFWTLKSFVLGKVTGVIFYCIYFIIVVKLDEYIPSAGTFSDSHMKTLLPPVVLVHALKKNILRHMC